MKKRIHLARVLAATATILLVTAACSSKSNSTGSNAGTSAGSTSATASGSGGSGGASGAAMIQTAKNSLGTILTDGKGHTLYVFAPDTSSTSTCYGICAKYWPPVLSGSSPVAGSGIVASKLATSPRKDGSKQVTYTGHPLYTFALDKASGDTKGQGLNQDGGLWWALGTDGNAIKGNGGASSSSGSGFTY